METNALYSVNSDQNADLFFDSDGVLNSRRISPCNTLSHLDDFYFKVKELSQGVKLKNIIPATQLINMDRDALFYFTREFSRLYSSMAIVSSNPLTLWRAKHRLQKLKLKLPIQFFGSVKNAKIWLTSEANPF
jgi:hypothetical protein